MKHKTAIISYQDQLLEKRDKRKSTAAMKVNAKYLEMLESI